MVTFATVPLREGTSLTHSGVNGILSNVVWIVEHLDDDSLDKLRDLPVLELAKHVSLAYEHPTNNEAAQYDNENEAPRRGQDRLTRAGRDLAEAAADAPLGRPFAPAHPRENEDVQSRRS